MFERLDPHEISRRIYEGMCRIAPGDPPRMRSWLGEQWGPSDARSTIVLNHPGALRALLIPPGDLAAGEAYIYDDIDIQGDIVQTLRFAAQLDAGSRIRGLSLLAMARTLPGDLRRHDHQRPELRGKRHSTRRDKEVVSFHYDTGNDFFETFLGQSMVYSCAHFLDPNEELDVAQYRKIDMVCRKLELAPGQRFLDVGCGWGSLVIHAAKEFGVDAHGVTVSAEQADYARQNAAEAGVADRVTIVEQDYRDIGGSFDAIASVGMFEHVGRGKLGTYLAVLRSHLAPGGLVLNHGIVERGATTPRQRAKSFVGNYVFPDGDLIAIGDVVTEAENAGFEVRDLEALRASYTQTLQCWVDNLEKNHLQAVEATSEQVYRIWRLYMAGSAVAFERAAIGVDQLLLADPARPWTFGRTRLLAADDN